MKLLDDILGKIGSNIDYVNNTLSTLTGNTQYYPAPPNPIKEGIKNFADITGPHSTGIRPSPMPITASAQTASVANAVPQETPIAPPPPEQTAQFNGVKITKQEFDQEFKPILFGEVSNRPGSKKRLEADVILGTALNRVSQKYGDSLQAVLTQPNQYQAYKGNQYNLYKTLGEDMPKKKEVDAIAEQIWQEISQGKYKDITGGKTNYSHVQAGQHAGKVAFMSQKEFSQYTSKKGVKARDAYLLSLLGL